jgi:hypothetical protein
MPFENWNEKLVIKLKEKNLLNKQKKFMIFIKFMHILLEKYRKCSIALILLVEKFDHVFWFNWSDKLKSMLIS